MANEIESSRGLHGLAARFLSKIWRFIERAWNLGVAEPKKFIHCLKVGLALSFVSLFYYVRPLYDGVGGTAMWAIMTVVVVFEYTVGATLYKCINRATATFLAGSLGVGVHWVASQSGEKFEPIILGSSVFLLASAATFSRFIPTIKARFDYGAMIFILTFSLVSLSGYRVDELLTMAQNRVSTILLGATICIVISMLLYPVWSGNELHLLLNRNMEKLADSLEGCVAEFFSNGNGNTSNEYYSKKLQGYKCVLNSKGTAESLYLKVEAAMRNCGFCIESLSSCIYSEVEVPKSLNKNLSHICMRLSSHCSQVLKELAATVKTTRKSSITDQLVGEMNFAVQELQNALKSLPNQLLQIDAKGEQTTKQFTVPLMEILPVATAISLLIEIALRIEGIVDAVDELADLAEFKPAIDEQSKQSQSTSDKADDDTIEAFQIIIMR
ncbi:hypothetical protein Vadar_027208 [Vaccinium darrowii]|uniref:Uncharacterized protein n=1 Tax=Vaccinium darrowii TaxID=229202 RepID=A0ACB7ZF33_9ERIC|nr:hypothetical protein Vadar_027208 [Vaccinium darrowii]